MELNIPTMRTAHLEHDTFLILRPDVTRIGGLYCRSSGFCRTRLGDDGVIQIQHIPRRIIPKLMYGNLPAVSCDTGNDGTIARHKVYEPDKERRKMLRNARADGPRPLRIPIPKARDSQDVDIRRRRGLR